MAIAINRLAMLLVSLMVIAAAWWGLVLLLASFAPHQEHKRVPVSWALKGGNQDACGSGATAVAAYETQSLEGTLKNYEVVCRLSDGSTTTVQTSIYH